MEIRVVSTEKLTGWEPSSLKLSDPGCPVYYCMMIGHSQLLDKTGLEIMARDNIQTDWGVDRVNLSSCWSC